MCTCVYHMRHFGAQSRAYCAVNECQQIFLCHVNHFFLSMCITLNHLSRDILAFRRRCVMKSIYGVILFSTCHHLCQWCASHHVTCHYHTFINTFIMPNHVIQHVICRFVHVTLSTLISIYFKANVIHSICDPHYNIHTILVNLGHGCVI